MMIAILSLLIFTSIIACGALLFSCLIFFKVPKGLMEHLVKHLSISTESNLQCYDKLALDYKDALQDYKEKTENLIIRVIREHTDKVAEQFSTECKVLTNSYQEVASHMQQYTAVLESQDRLIQAVGELVDGQSSNRRHK